MIHLKNKIECRDVMASIHKQCIGPGMPKFPTWIDGPSDVLRIVEDELFEELLW
jgi:hypothetical protein